MTPTGHKDRAAAVLAHVKRRGEIRHEHTREVRSELPDDVRAMIIEMQGEISKHALQLIELKMQLADVSAALADYVRRVA
jgi:hypothetical protein